jgi:hypothetical protein
MNAPAQSILASSENYLLAKVGSVLMALSFAIALVFTYVNYLSPIWKYMGFTYREPATSLFAAAFAAAVLPAAFLTSIATKPGDFIRWVVYFGLYIPAIMIPPVMGNLPERDSYLLLTSLTAAMLIILVRPAGRTVERITPLAVIDSNLFWVAFLAIYAGLNIWVVAIFGSHLHIADITEIYAQRAEANEGYEGSLVGYATGFLSGAFNPFLMAVALTERRPVWYVLGAMGQVLIFSVAAGKAVAASIIVIPVFYFLMFRGTRYSVWRIGLAFTVTAVALTLVAAEVYTGKDLILQFVFSVIFMRTFSMSGCLTGIYAEFFLTHPWTYYSHISIIRMYVPYPYPDTLGMTIGDFITPTGLSPDANTNFFATDGVAAFGYIGVVLAGLLFRMFIFLFDHCCNRRTMPLVCCAMLQVLVSVMNGSVFTTLLSSGGAVLALIVFIYSSTTRSDEPSPA